MIPVTQKHDHKRQRKMTRSLLKTAFFLFKVIPGVQPHAHPQTEQEYQERDCLYEPRGKIYPGHL